MNIKDMKKKDADEKAKATPFGKKDDAEAKPEGKVEAKAGDKGPPSKPKGKAPHMKGSSPMAEPEAERAEAEMGVVEADEGLAETELETAGAGAPQPSAPIPMADVKEWTDAVNEAVGVLANGQVPPVTADLPEQATEWNKPLPPKVFGLTMILMQAISQQDPSGQFASLTFDPMTLGASAEGVKEMTDKLRMIASDPALKEALSKPVSEVDPSMAGGPSMGGSAAAPPQPPPPGGDISPPMV